MDKFLAAPVIFPLVMAILLAMMMNRPALQKVVNLIGATIFLAFTFVVLITVHERDIISIQLGGWKAPYGITLVADNFSALMLFITGILTFCTAIYSMGSMDEKREKLGYYPLLNLMIMGISGAFLTGDIFNLYVWFEVFLMASFVLISLGSSKEQLEGAVKYVTINIISSVILLTGVGFLYALTGTLNMAHLALRITEVENQNMVITCGMFFLIAFGIKAAIFPLYFWMTASYHTPPPAVSAIFAGLLTKVGVYGIIRVNSLIFMQNPDYPLIILLVIAAFTMVIGVLGAVAQHQVRKILAFHKVSQIGYLILGFAVFTHLSLAAGIFYMFHYMLVKTNLFFISGIIEKVKHPDIYKAGGLYRQFPLLATLFLISALSLSGIPPLSGFWAKFLLIKATFEADEFLLGGIGLAVGLLTLLSMTKIWKEAFWNEGKQEEADLKTGFSGMVFQGKWTMLIPVILIAILVVAIGFFPSGLYTFCEKASEQLHNPSAYIKTILPAKP